MTMAHRDLAELAAAAMVVGTEQDQVEAERLIPAVVGEAVVAVAVVLALVGLAVPA